MLFKLFLIGLFLIGCTNFDKSEISNLKKLSQIEILTNDATHPKDQIRLDLIHRAVMHRLEVLLEHDKDVSRHV